VRGEYAVATAVENATTEETMAERVRIVHVAEVRARAGVRDEELIAASQEAQDGFFALQSGYVGRELFKSSDGVWLDIMYWDDEADAAKARDAFRGHPSTRRFGSLLEPSTFKMTEYRSIRSY
jgi:hypothetical protein